MVPTHVWDAVPSDVVTSVILAAAAATAAGVLINEYQDSKYGSNADPMIVHAGASVRCPPVVRSLSLAHARQWAGHTQAQAAGTAQRSFRDAATHATTAQCFARGRVGVRDSQRQHALLYELKQHEACLTCG